MLHGWRIRTVPLWNAASKATWMRQFLFSLVWLLPLFSRLLNTVHTFLVVCPLLPSVPFCSFEYILQNLEKVPWEFSFMFSVPMCLEIKCNLQVCQKAGQKSAFLICDCQSDSYKESSKSDAPTAFRQFQLCIRH